jgi:hypothetical protein
MKNRAKVQDATQSKTPRPHHLASAGPTKSPQSALITQLHEETQSRPAANPSDIAGFSQTNDSAVDLAGCASCGPNHHYFDGPAFVGGCPGGGCIPGRPPCEVPARCSFIGQFCANLYECFCCPDPCYEPAWIPAANAGFFLDYARPRTVTRIRFDRGLDMSLPDRNEFFYKVVPAGTFPGTGSKTRPYIVHGVRYRSDPSLNFSQLYLYQEAAAARGSFFFEIPYRQINPIFSPTHAGFADLNLGTKALLYDCEIFQFTFQFRTYLPTGNAMEGLGTGHVSLEPSLLASLRLGPQTYLQAQLAQWIPLGGTTNFAGGILQYFFSLNQVLYNWTSNTMLIGTLEFDGWSFQNGAATNPVVYPGIPSTIGSSNNSTYFNIGPGLRMSICNQVDFGGAVTFAASDKQWADVWGRLEVRFLY